MDETPDSLSVPGPGTVRDVVPDTTLKPYTHGPHNRSMPSATVALVTRAGPPQAKPGKPRELMQCFGLLERHQAQQIRSVSNSPTRARPQRLWLQS